LEEGNNPDEPGWFLQWLQNRTSVYAYSFDEAWFDIGTPESYLNAVSWVLDGESVVSGGAHIINSEIGENVYVMPGAEIRDATVEESVVFSDATIVSSTVERCIIDESSSIHNVDLRESQVGAHTKISHKVQKQSGRSVNTSPVS
jgi:glucose-1-phosphate thymidylyltransferase